MKDNIIRPTPVTLESSALVPDKNLISPAPNQFTHKLTRQQPFYFADAQKSATPDGQLAAGTRVVLLVYNGGTYCHIVDGQGLYVQVEYSGLEKL